MGRAPKIAVRLLAVLGGLALATLATEGLVYLLDPYGAPTQAANGRLYQERICQLDLESPRIFRHLPGAEVQMRGHLFRTDSRGLRGPERETPKPAGTKRLFFLGDSVVLGWGVAEEETFVRLTEEALRERTGETWETVNGGHNLHDTTQELAVLEEVGLAYEPDVVVLVFVENDIVSTRSVFELNQSGPGEEVSEEARTILRRAEQLARIKPYLPNLHATLEYVLVSSSPAGQQGSNEHAEELGIPLLEGWEASKAALTRMRTLSEEHGFRFGVFDYRRGTKLSEELAAFCASARIPYASIAFTEEEDEASLRNSAADAHANPLGHELLTAHVLDALVETGLIEGLERTTE